MDKALATLDELVKAYPKSAQVESAQVNRAQALYRLGRFEESLNAVRELLKAFPQSGYRASALYVGAIDQRNLGDEKEAERTLREVVAAYPNSPFVYEARLLIGESLAGQGRVDEAVAYYRQLETDAPESRKAAVELGMGSALMRAGKYAEAERTFDGVIQNYATSAYAAPAALQRAVAQLKAGQRNDARSALSAAARQYPQLAASAAYWLARADLLDGKYEEAARQLERLMGKAVPANIAAMPKAPEAEFDLAYCELRLGHDAVALQRLEAFRAKYPRSIHAGETLFYEASALYGLGQFAKSVEFCEAVQKLGQSSVRRDAAMLEGESLLMLGDYAKADAIFAPLEQSEASDEERLRLRFRRGQCAYFSGDYAAAETRLAEVSRSAAKGDPNLGEAEFLLGDAQLRQGKDAEAEATLKDYIAAAKTNGQNAKLEEALFKLATAQERLKENDPAAATLRTVMDAAGTADLKSPWAQRAWFESGQLAFQRGDAAAASQAIEKVLAAKPDAAIAAPALYLLARIEISEGKTDEAAARLAELSRDYPRDSLSEDAAFVRGIALKNAQHPDDAAKQFSAYLQAYPTGKYVTQARHERAVALTVVNNPAASAEAIRMLSDLANGSGRSDTVLYDLAWAYRRAGDEAQTEATYSTLLKDYPDGAVDRGARGVGADSVCKKRYSEAAELLKTAMSDARALPHLHGVAMYWSAACAARLGNDARAAKLFDAFASANPKAPLTPDALGEAGVAYANLQKFDVAEQRQRRVISDFPGTDAATLAAVRLGEAQNQAGDYAGAAEIFTKWLADHSRDPLMPRARFGLGWSLENRGKTAAAREQYVQVVAADNGESGARAQFQIGETWFAEKQYETAAKELLKVDILYNAPQWAARALYEAGRSFETLRQPERARQQFAACVSKYKDSDVAPLAKKRLEALTGSAQ